jgi:hypothetical protein
MRPVVAYYRVSTDKQGKAGPGIEAQRPGRLRARRHPHRRDGRRCNPPIAAGLHGRIKTCRLDADSLRR